MTEAEQQLQPQPQQQPEVDDNEEIPGEISFKEEITAESKSIQPVIVMCKAGNCEWNERNFFVGWFDSTLSKVGTDEVRLYAEKIKNTDILFDIAFTSELSRAKDTLEIIIEETDQKNIKIESSWTLNDRHYGALTGMNIDETIAQFSHEQVDYWINYYVSKPPPIYENHKYYDNIYQAFYDKIPIFPLSESLETLNNRVIHFWINEICPYLKNEKKVLLVADSIILTIINKHIEFFAFCNDLIEHDFSIDQPYRYEFDESLVPISKKNL